MVVLGRNIGTVPEFTCVDAGVPDGVRSSCSRFGETGSIGLWGVAGGSASDRDSSGLGGVCVAGGVGVAGGRAAVGTGDAAGIAGDDRG